MRHTLCVICDVFSQSLTSDFSLPSAHWTWFAFIHLLGSHLLPNESRSRHPLVTNLPDTVSFVIYCNLWQPVTLQKAGTSEQVWDEPLKPFHVMEFRCWTVTLPNCPPLCSADSLAGSSSCSVCGHYLYSDQFWGISHEGCVFRSVLNPGTQNRQQKLLGVQNEWWFLCLLTRSWATLKLRSKTKSIQTICHYLLRFDCWR